MSGNFSVGTTLVRTERSVVGVPAKRASFANAYDPFDPEGAGYHNNTRASVALNVRTEKQALASKRFRPPGDGRFFDGHH